jgi:hypothetical protein
VNGPASTGVLSRCTGSETSPSTKTTTNFGQDQHHKSWPASATWRVGALRAAGHTKITASLRWISRSPIRALNILADPHNQEERSMVRHCLSP